MSLPTRLRLASTRRLLPRCQTLNPILNRKQSSNKDEALSSGQGAKGKTGGGPALGSTARGAPEGPPKVVNARVSAVEPERDFDDEQRREVERHNEAFERKHDVSQAAPGGDSKVDEKFWKSGR
ncbi:hypothetical protein L249_8583 [Ophiocordyceps polyrhachis-furcata BCC 54312]|uniref:Uncharacterized protein n=1 Tax=Ophiocordyceps polyrhachis-furcata BCC 54312 TaxID=1330021 RepID=A0A367L696_9HYPO|nr:hypothetical protein L249_8583 [Ophiocordyceps polyrhachis-furcata BCC 54312]